MAQATDFVGEDFTLVRTRWAGIGKDSALTDFKGKTTVGLLEEKKGGTIFIDELADVPLKFQQWLRPLLDRADISPGAGIGDPIKPDVRFIFATWQVPEELVKKSILIFDVWRRIGERCIRIPPLSERKEDIPLFLQSGYSEFHFHFKTILALLQSDWTGNVGELQDVLKLAVGRAKAASINREPRSKSRAGKVPKRSSNPEVRLEYLGWEDKPFIKKIEALEDKIAESQCVAELQRCLTSQGIVKGKGLQNEIAKMLDCSPSKISGMLRKLSN